MLGSPGKREVDALAVDQALAEVRSRLGAGSAGPVGLLDLIQFVDGYLRHLTPIEHVTSFLQETLVLFDSALDAPFDPSGLNPEHLERSASLIAELRDATSSNTADKRTARVIDRLHILAVCQYAIVQSYEDVLRLLRLQQSEVETEPRSLNDTPRWLHSLLNIRYPQHAEWSDAEMRFISAWKDAPEGVCRFPAVLNQQQMDGITQPDGYVRRLELRIRKFASDTDDFSMAFATETDADVYLDRAVSAGRTVLGSITPNAADKSYAGDFRLMNSGLGHAGQSAGLALATLFVCEAQKFSEQRTLCRILPGTVLTGAVDEAGAIREVAPDSLAAKVRTVFFSPARTFVLPEAQADVAEHVVARLRERYPRRNLLVLGKKTLNDAFSDRRVISISEVGRIRHGAVRFWKRKWAVSSVATALFFIALSFAAWWYMVDPYPAGLEVTTEGVRLTNVNQRVIWSKEANQATIDYHRNRATNHTYTSLVDVNGDGYKDGFWIEYTESESRSETMFSIDGQTLDPLWPPMSVDLDIDYPYDVSITHGRMRPTTILVDDLEGNGTFELVVALHHRSYYPAAILTLDAQSGEVRGTYHHPGAFSILTASDIDADGKKEIMAGGTNNAFNDAIVVVLDPEHLSGIGPARGDYRSSKPPTALEDHYIRFPRTPLAQFAGINSAFINNIMVLEEDAIIRLSSRSVVLVRDSGEKVAGGPAWEMDFSMRTVAMGTSDAFDAVYDLAREQGVVNGQLDNAFKIFYMGTIRRFTKDGWEPVPYSERANLPPGYLGENSD